MHSARENVCKICLKAIRDTFFSDMIRGGTGGLNILVGMISSRSRNVWLAQRSSHKEIPEERTWSAYCNGFEKHVNLKWF